MDNFIIICKDILTNYPFVAPLFAAFGGFLASFSPCNLSSIPLILGYIGKDENKKNITKLTISFILGNSIIFVLLGAFSTYFSVFGLLFGKWWYVVLSFILIIMVLEMWNVTHIFKSSKYKLPKRGVLGAFSTGILSGIMASPCSTPILIIVLTIASTKNIIYGSILLLYYAIGHNALVILSIFTKSKITNIKRNKKYKKYNNLVNIIFGIIILLLAFYFYYLGI